ncbi:MAG: type IV toxin-antitoxin system AbiEi family antitoxin [Vicingaceae bacterium]
MKQEVIHKALINLKHTIDIEGFLLDSGELDGKLQLTINGKVYNFVAEVKKELRLHQLQPIEKLHHQHANLIVIAENIFPKIKEELRKKGIAYLESNGNLFIQNKEFYLFIDTNKKEKLKKENTNRAFTKTGLKVVFHFLLNADLVNQTQREIAEIAGVGLGNIPQVINGLKETGYLLALNRKTYVWEHRKELLDRWINQYATDLRPKLIKDRYDLKDNWQELNLDSKQTVWGGEPAADLLTNHLRPEKFILYTKEDTIDLLRNYRLVPDKKGAVEVLDLFWNNLEEEKTTPPILIYAELILEGGKRNRETAKMIYEKYIEAKL